MRCDIKSSSENYIELKRMGSPDLEHSIKVRKPYTITKQRERWTEEEHNKFLEALKLYGRAWRHIEEHIGSKTAVQIRSHAQKFFTKAACESETIEIPPPRPKKRPMRPYPRKLGHLPSIPVMGKFPVPEQDNQSPTSVMPSTSDQMNSCTSPVSSVAGSDPIGTLLCEQETVCHSPTMPVDDEDESVPQQTSDMEVDLGSDDSIPSKVASLVEAPLASLRLFGKTVIVAEPQKPSNLNTENTEPAITTGVAEQPPRRVHEQCINGSVPWAITMAPAFYILPSHGNLASSAEAGAVPMPWFWAVPDENRSSVREYSDDGGTQKESSSGGSNSIALTVNNYHGLDDRGGMPAGLKRSETSAFRILKAAPKKDGKGFVPYKRCNESKGDQ